MSSLPLPNQRSPLPTQGLSRNHLTYLLVLLPSILLPLQIPAAPSNPCVLHAQQALNRVIQNAGAKLYQACQVGDVSHSMQVLDQSDHFQSLLVLPTLVSKLPLL